MYSLKRSLIGMMVVVVPTMIMVMVVVGHMEPLFMKRTAPYPTILVKKVNLDEVGVVWEFLDSGSWFG